MSNKACQFFLLQRPYIQRPGALNESYYSESVRHLDIRSRDHLGMSPLTENKVKLSNNTAICDHSFHCKFLPSFDNFSVLAHDNEKYWKLKKIGTLILHLCSLIKSPNKL